MLAANYGPSASGELRLARAFSVVTFSAVVCLECISENTL